MNIKDIMERVRTIDMIVPAFNIPYLPMLKPTAEAVADQNSFALIEVARPEWEKFEAKSLEAVQEEFSKRANLRFLRLHLDHIPVVDEDFQSVDYMPLIARAIACGFHSVMIDGSRLPLDKNITATTEAVAMAHEAGIPCEAELGAVMGHEEGPMPEYEELFRTGKGFTDPDEARRFVEESQVDWLSAAFGSIHGAISVSKRSEKKVQARLNMDHLDALVRATNRPIVLHGGSGIRSEDIRTAYKHGVTKINVGTETRQAYENAAKNGDIEAGRSAVYEVVTRLIADVYQIAGSRSFL